MARSDIFIPPFNKFNLHTIEVMVDLSITIFFTHPDAERATINPHKTPTLITTNNSKLEFSKVSDHQQSIYHVPFLVALLRLEGEAMRLIDESIAKYGFAQVRLHPSDFDQVDVTAGKPTNAADSTRFQHLAKIVDMLADRNIRIASFRDISPPHSPEIILNN
ncbi:MAG: hypothetical protein ACJ70Q_09555 [Nitrososphaera sp.]